MDFHDLRSRLEKETEDFVVTRNGTEAHFKMPEEIVSCLHFLLSEHVEANCKYYIIEKEAIEWWDTPRRRSALFKDLADFSAFSVELVIKPKSEVPNSILITGPENAWAELPDYKYPTECDDMKRFIIGRLSYAVQSGSVVRLRKSGAKEFKDYDLQTFLNHHKECHAEVSLLGEEHV